MARQLGPRDPFKLVIDRAEMNRLLSSEDGPVALDLAKKAQRVAARQRRRAPRKTGHLKSLIRWRIGKDEQGLFADVGVLDSPEIYPAIVEKGHRAPDGSRVSPRRYVRSGLAALRPGTVRRH